MIIVILIAAIAAVIFGCIVIEEYDDFRVGVGVLMVSDRALYEESRTDSKLERS